MSKFFYTFDESGKLDKQGMVLGRSCGQVRVQLFSWITGEPNGQQMFTDQDTETWRFYNSHAEWLADAESVDVTFSQHMKKKIRPGFTPW